MQTHTIYFRGTRDDVQQIVGLVPRLLSGAASGHENLVFGFKMRLANTALSKIKTAFETKADGRTDEAGQSWHDLSREYKAYGRRFGRGEQLALRRAAGIKDRSGTRFAPGGKSGLLTDAQLAKWRRIYAQALAQFLVRGEPLREAKSHAAAVAWIQIKAEGGQTKLNVYGSRKLQILRDTGILFNSLSPGVEDKFSGAEGQVVRDVAGAVIFGTNAPYALFHHKGKGRRRRPLWPDPVQWPDAWWNAIAAAGSRGVVRLAVVLLEQQGGLAA